MSTLSPDDLNALSAFLDGELDAPASLEVERRIERDAEFAHEYRAMLALSQGIGAKLAMDTPTERLRRRLDSIAEAPTVRPRLPSAPLRTARWPGLALAAGLSAIVASGATYGLMDAGRQDPMTQDQLRQDLTTNTLVAAHLRGLLAQRPIDIESSDRHTVKPWFNQRLSFSPIVPDEPIPDFDLLGGRMEVVDGQPAATLVYRHKNHVLSLTQARTDQPGPGDLKQSVNSGLTEMRWKKDGISFYLVTDLPAAELSGFTRHWQ